MDVDPSRLPKDNKAEKRRNGGWDHGAPVSRSLPFPSPERRSKGRLSLSSSPRQLRHQLRRRSRSLEQQLDQCGVATPDSAALKLKTLLLKHERKRSDSLPLPDSPELRLLQPTHGEPPEETSSWEQPPSIPGPEDLVPFLNSQAAYIQQLEGENKFRQEEFVSLRSKTEEVIQENTRLQEELKSVIVSGLIKTENEMPAAIQKNEQGQSVPSPLISQSEGEDKRTYFIAWSKEHDKLKSLYESRLKLLQSQLDYTRSELAKHEKLCNELKTRLRTEESERLMQRMDDEVQSGLCVQCARGQAVIAPSANTNRTEDDLVRVTRERDDLVESLTAVRARMVEMQGREGEAYHQVQQGIILVEQAQLDRTEALYEREQLKEDLQRMEQRLNQLIADAQQKLERERSLTRQESQQEIATLNQKILQIQNEGAACQVELERTRNEKDQITLELEATKTQLREQEAELDKFSDGAQFTTATAKVQRDSALRQMERIRSSLELELQTKEQERMRLFSEVQEVRRRMDSAERGLTLSKEEIVNLTDQLNTVERELSMVRVSKETLEKTRAEEVKLVTRRAEQKKQELKQVIHEMEAQHSLVVTGLEAMISDQNSLISKLRDQAKFLTGKLERITDEYSQEKHRMKQNNRELVSRSDRLAQQHSQMEEQCIQHGRLHQKLGAKLQKMADHADRTSKQIYSLLESQRALLEERSTLTREIDFLRSQLRDEQNLAGGSKAPLRREMENPGAEGRDSQPEYIPTRDVSGIGGYEDG